MILRLHQDEFAWFQANPMVWWAASARWAFDRVAPGEPGIETDEEGEPTGYLLMSHPDIDHRDIYIMEVCLAGIDYTQSLPEEDGQALAYLQAVKDLENLQNLIALKDSGEISREDAIEQIWQEALRQGQTLGLEYVPPVAQESID